MVMVRQTFGCRIPTLLLVALALSQFLLSVNADVNKTHHVIDRGYGQALYEHFQQNNLRAITTLMVADQQPQTSRQQDQSDLLLADLYYRYGLFSESDRLFSRLLTDDIDHALLTRVKFNLARLNHEQGNNQESLKLLSLIDSPLPDQLQDEKQYLLTNLFIINQNIEEAKKTSSTINPKSIWYHYAGYNLGIGLIENGQLDEGLTLLEQINLLEEGTEELLALRDQVNLSMGLSLLRVNRPETALNSLQRIRLDGPLSHTALLATGWAWTGLEQSAKALVPWLELANKNTVDAATQEALLAIPTTLEQNSKPKLAVQYFTLAANQFDRQLEVLEQSVKTIRAGELIGLLNQNALIYPNSAKFAASSLQSTTAPYLHILIASADFHRELKRYQELVDISSTLNHWNRNLPTLSLMLDERRQRFVNKQPLLEQTSSFENLSRLRRSRDDLAVQLKLLESDDSSLELATEQEKIQLQRLDKIAANLISIGERRDTSDKQDMHRLLNGLLSWQIRTSYATRLWTAKKQFIGLDTALSSASTRAESLRQIGVDSISRFDQFKARISTQRGKIGGLIERVANLMNRQEERINLLAISTIELQKQHIIQLRLNARYSLARLYDKLVTE